MRGRDVESVVNEIQRKLDAELDLAPGYYLKYGGSFENLTRAKDRLAIIVPIALALIFVLLYFALKSFTQTFMIYMAIPLSAIGGIFALWLRDMPFSISAGVGFIVLFGVAVLNGLVLITSMNDLKLEGMGLKERIIKGTKERIRPIFLTASTDILGFLPMAISTSSGAEVQRPLATVVIGGMLTASLLTLFVIPILYNIVEVIAERRKLGGPRKKLSFAGLVAISVIGFFMLNGQTMIAQETIEKRYTLEEAIAYGLKNNESIKSANFEIERLKALKKSSFDIGKTDVRVDYGKLNGFEKDMSFSIEQKFQFPTVYTSKNNLAKASIEKGELEKVASEVNLIKEIKLTWYQLVYLKEVQSLLEYQNKMYSQFLKAASLRYEVEAGTLLEKVTAEAKITKIETDILQNESNIKIYKKRLKTLLCSPFTVNIIEEYVAQNILNLDLEAGVISENPTLSLLNNQVNVKEKEVALNSAKLLPEFTVGYFNQSMIGNHTKNGVDRFYSNSQRFSSVQATISIPLWVKPDRARIKAAKLDREKAESDAIYGQKVLKGEYERVVQEFFKYKTTLKYYKEKALPQAELILSNSKKSFDNGAIDYVEYMQGLTNGIEIKSNYLSVLNQYNQSIIAIEYLVGIKN